jgi:Ca2+-binding RTX toxin-like protein
MSARRNRRKKHRLLFLPPAALAVLAIGVGSFALTNAILGVSSPNLGENTSAITPTALEPPLCVTYGIAPTNVIAGTNGTGNSDLILGTNGRDNISGNGGNDCLVGGDGNDTLNGGNGNDVCIGGPGRDTFNSCAHCDTVNCTRG